MATIDDVRALALALPQVSEASSRGSCAWRVADKLFAWERPLRAKEAAELGADAPRGPILAARVEHLLAKEALLLSEPAVFFTTSHFDGYAAVLIRLEQIPLPTLHEVVVEAWLCRAPRRLAQRYASEQLPPHD